MSNILNANSLGLDLLKEEACRILGTSNLRVEYKDFVCVGSKRKTILKRNPNSVYFLVGFSYFDKNMPIILRFMFPDSGFTNVYSSEQISSFFFSALAVQEAGNFILNYLEFSRL